MSVKKISLIIVNFFNLDILEVISPTSFKVKNGQDEVFTLNTKESQTYVDFYKEKELIGTHFK